MTILLYATTEFNLVYNSWPFLSTLFIKNGQSFWTAYNTDTNTPGRSVDIISEATAIASTIFADCTIVLLHFTLYKKGH